MSDIRLQVDVREAVDDLSLVEQKILVQYLKNEMGEDFDQPLTEEEAKKARYSDLEADVWVDADDVVSEMSTWDRKDLYNELKEEFEDEESDGVTPFSGGSYSERELGAALSKLWEDRWLLTNEQKARIEAITKESFV
jgi:hypothetical protein